MTRAKSESVKTDDKKEVETPKVEDTKEEVADVKQTKEGKSVDVYTFNGNYVRTFSEKMHGEDWLTRCKKWVAADKNRLKDVNNPGVYLNKPKYVIK